MITTISRDLSYKDSNFDHFFVLLIRSGNCSRLNRYAKVEGRCANLGILDEGWVRFHVIANRVCLHNSYILLLNLIPRVLTKWIQNIRSVFSEERFLPVMSKSM